MSSEVRDLLEQAASCERAGDPTEAVARARLAWSRAKDPDSHEDTAMALARLEAVEQRWREAVAERKRAFEARERCTAGVTDPPPPAEKSPGFRRWRERGAHRRLFRVFGRAVAAALSLSALMTAEPVARAEPPPSPNAATVEYSPWTPDLGLYEERGVIPVLRLEGHPRFWWLEHGYVPRYGLVCPGPCTTTLAPGSYRLALSKDGGPPIPAREIVSINGPSTIRASYVDRSGERLSGALVGVGGGVIGTLMAIGGAGAAAIDACDARGFCYHQVNQPLVVTGIGIAVASIVAGAALASRADEAHVAVAPATTQR